MPIDERDAVRMEGIMRFLPEKDRDLLVGHYIYRAGWQSLSRILVLPINRDQYNQRLRRAALMAYNRFEVVR
jgi:hypothetical protein